MRTIALIMGLFVGLTGLACSDQPPDFSEENSTGGGTTSSGGTRSTGGTGVAGGGALGGTSGGVAGGAAGTSAISGAGGAIGTGGSSAGSTSIGGAGLTGGAGGAETGGSGGFTSGAGGSAGAIAGGGVAGSIVAGAGGMGGRATGGSAGTAGGMGGRAAGGSAGTAGGGGGGAFDPCPATGVCKILPLGDSITDGLVVPGGYRIELFRLAHQANKQITYVGGSMNGPMTVDGVMFPRAHEGHSGWTIAQIDGIVPTPALGVNPHIVLLHIGTNDMVGTPSGAPDRLGTLIDQIVTALPNTLLVVSNIIPLGSGGGAVTTYNAAVPGVVSMRRNAGKHLLFVDQYTGFPTSELADGVHPNEAGYARMARAWYAAISPYLH